MRGGYLRLQQLHAELVQLVVGVDARVVLARRLPCGELEPLLRGLLQEFRNENPPNRS